MKTKHLFELLFLAMVPPSVQPEGQNIAGKKKSSRLGTLLATASIFCLIAFAPKVQAFPSWIGNCCSHANQVTPSGTLYAGDDVTFVKMLNQDYVGLHCEVQISTTGNSGYSANQMTYGGNDSGNSWWTYTRKFASGTVWFYHDGWQDFDGSHIYDNNGGANFTQTITALNAPSGQSATTISPSQINLAWTQGTSGNAKNTTILRSAGSAPNTDPTQGTSYSVGNTIGNATVILANAVGTTLTDTGLTPGTTYYYKFYANNFNYYSTSVSASATAQAVDEYWRTDGTSGGTWTSTYWNRGTANTTGGTGWSDGNNAVFTGNSTLTFASSTVGNVTVSANQTVTVTAGGTLNLGGAVRIFDIGSGALLDWRSQNVTANSAAGITKNSAGTLRLDALTFTTTMNGGFTLNAGTVVVTGAKAFGNGSMTINGGAIQSSSGITFALTSLTIGGDFAFAGTGNDLWNQPVSVGSSTRTITNNTTGTATRTFGQVISGGAGAGLTFTGTGGSGGIVLANANTYSGNTTINGGKLALSASGSIANSPNIVVAASTVLDISAVTGGFTLGAAQTLKGSGTVVGNVTVSGTIAAGSSVGTLTETGSLTWAPGGTNEVEMSSATGVPGTDWDLLSISGDLTVTATNHVGGSLSDVNKFKIRLVSLAGFSGFVNTQSNAWTIATVGGSVKEFIPSKFVVDTRAFAQELAGTFSVALENKEVKLVYTPTTCSATTPAYYVENNPGNKLVVMTFSNPSGLTSAQALRMDNCSITGRQYPSVSETDTNAGSAIPGSLSLTTRTLLDPTTKKVVLWVKKISQSIDAVVNVLVMDNCGGGKSFDPVITTLTVASGNRVQQRFEGVLSAERYLHVVNSTPGLKWLEVNLNGRVFRLDPMADGQDLSADLVAAMHEGDNNTVILTGGGEVGASAVVMITDTAAGSLIALPEVLTLRLSQTPGGLALAWPDTLAGWQLQSSATAQGTWTDVTATPAVVSGQFTVTMPAAETAQFYRLHQTTTTAVTSTASEAAVNLSGNPQSQPLQQTYDGLLW